MTTPEERMYRFMDENIDQFRGKTLEEIIIAHRQHEHEITKVQVLEKANLVFKPEKGGKWQ